MDEQGNPSNEQSREEIFWEIPDILEQGHVEARLFSDEPDPWGGP